MQKHTHGGDIYSTPGALDFSANINPLGLPERVIEAACEGVRRSTAYPDVEMRELKAALSESEGVPTEQIICGNGAAQLIFALASSVKPRAALLAAPGFAEYATALRTTDCAISYHICTEQDDFAVNDRYLRALENWEWETRKTHRTANVPAGSNRDASPTGYRGASPTGYQGASPTGYQGASPTGYRGASPMAGSGMGYAGYSRMIFLCNPNNPTGHMLTREQLKEIAGFCKDHGILMVLDECFIPLTTRAQECTMVGELENYPNLFLLKAFTKLYAMPGLRLGYGMTNNRQLLEELASIMQPWTVSIPAQMAGVAALKEKDYAEKTPVYVAERRVHLRKDMQDLGLKVYPGEANYLFFKGPQGLYDKCQKRGILIRDCSNYIGLTEGYYRVAVRNEDENAKLVSVLREACAESQDEYHNEYR